MNTFKKYTASKKVLSKPLIMGILNITPDSFSDGGQLYRNGKIHLQKIIKRGHQMINEGADIIDIGGESTGPTSDDVTLQEELKRVIPAVKAIQKLKKTSAQKFFISVDTYKAEVARQAIEAGADMINDVTALRGDPEMAKVIAKFDVPVIIMYAKDSTPRTTQKKVQYADVIKTIKKFLQKRIEYGLSQGIKKEQFIVDPGMGAFVSTDAKYSLEILRRLQELKSFRLPILIGASRKGFIGQTLAKKGKPLPSNERLEGSLACAAIAVMNGATIIRAHDVKETKKIVDVAYQIQRSNL